MIKGIDVSKHNGKIDWPKVKAADYAFAIIRVGWTHYEGGLTLDDRFAENMTGAAAAGLPVGAYAYGYDLSPEAARISAARVIEAVKPYRLEFPLYYDQEYEAKILALSTQTRTDICKAFMDAVQAAQYYSGLYASRDWLESKVYSSLLLDYDKWVAAYRYDMPVPVAETSGYGGSHGMWQYTVIGTQGTKGKHYWTTGSVPGVTGNCDVNVAYRDYPAIIRAAGLNGLEETDIGIPTTVPRAEYDALQAKYDALCAEIVVLAEKCK